MPSEIEFSKKKVLHPTGHISDIPVQAQSWPIAMSDRDLISIAKTGSGKTLGNYFLTFFFR